MDWKTKRDEILKRDNYTCRNCFKFNPLLGDVIIDGPIKGSIEIHKAEIDYINGSYSTTYSIAYNYDPPPSNITVKFEGCRPVFPTLQVHHKKYVNGKEKWEYDDDDLVTLCKECHTTLHLNFGIPVFSNENDFIEQKSFVPEKSNDDYFGFEPGIFVSRKNDGKYYIANINPSVTAIHFDSEDQDDDEMQKSVNEKVEKLIIACFPKYKKDK